MLEHIRSVASCRLKKKGRAFAILFLCALLYSPSPTFASSGAIDGIMPVDPKTASVQSLAVEADSFRSFPTVTGKSRRRRAAM